MGSVEMPILVPPRNPLSLLTFRTRMQKNAPGLNMLMVPCPTTTQLLELASEAHAADRRAKQLPSASSMLRPCATESKDCKVHARALWIMLNWGSSGRTGCRQCSASSCKAWACCA